MLLPFLAAVVLPYQAPDLAIVNAKIWTDGKIQEADCLTVSKGRITFLGGLSGLRLGKSTKVVDASVIHGQWRATKIEGTLHESAPASGCVTATIDWTFAGFIQT